MKRNLTAAFVVFLSLLSLAACGGGGGGGGTSPATYTVGGTISGLAGTVVLQNNGGDDLSIGGNGSFTFATPLANGASYAVTMLTPPTGQTCTITNDTGTIASANVTHVAVNCTTNPVQMGGSIQGPALNLTGAVTTLAGTPLWQDGTGTAASFSQPDGVVQVGENLYVADTYNSTIRKIVIGTGVVTTLAGTTRSAGSTDGTGTAARFYYPRGITSDGTSLYIADGSSNIRKITPASGGLGAMTSANAVVTTLAGSAGSAGVVDGTGTAARFNYPSGITTDDTSLYVADTYNSTIRKITPASGGLGAMTSANAVVTTLAGSAGSAGVVDGTGTAARFNYPSGITTDDTSLYVADTYNSTIRKIVIGTGVVTTLAGTAGNAGSVDGTGTAARFNHSSGITTDGISLYVADTYSHTIRKITPASGSLGAMTSANAVVTTLAGSAYGVGSVDGTGTAARFFNASGITTDGTNLYVVDTYNSTIRKIIIGTGVVTTLAGTAASADGIGAAARFKVTGNYTTDGTNLYVADYNYTIRKIVIGTGVVTTLAGTAGSPGSVDGTGTAARFFNASGITTDGTSLYVTNTSSHTIRKITPASGSLGAMTSANAVVTTLAGSANSAGSADGTGTSARFNQPYGITTDGTNLYVADTYNYTIRKITPATGSLGAMTSANAVVTTLAGSAGSFGSADGVSGAAQFYYPHGITTDGTSLYVADTSNLAIRKIVIGTGVVTTLAGGSYGSADGTGTAAQFNRPYGITTDGTSLYVADTYNHTIRKITPASGGLGAMTSANAVVTTLAGSADSAGVVDGTGSAARFMTPWGITTDGSRLFIGDSEGGTARAMQ